MRRIALVAAPVADADPHGVHGALDGDAMRVRLAQEDAGFEVHDLDPGRDLAEQLDEVFDRLAGEEVEAIFYASAPVVLAPDGELYLCLDPREIETGDALGELAGVFTDRARGRRLFVLDCRFSASVDPLLGVSCMESIQARLRGRAEVLAAARPLEDAGTAAVSPLTRAVLRALDDTEPGRPMTARNIHVRIVEEAEVAGEVKALAYLSHGPSLRLLRGGDDTDDQEEPEPRPARRRRSTHMGVGDAPGSTADAAVGDEAPASLPYPAAATSMRAPDARMRTTSLRVGPEAAVRARRHLLAAGDLLQAGLLGPAQDELRRAAQVAPPELSGALARQRVLVADALGEPADPATLDEALVHAGDDRDLLSLRARALADAAATSRDAAEDAWLAALAADAPGLLEAQTMLARRATSRGDDARAALLLERAAEPDDATTAVLVAARAAASRAGDARGLARWTRRLADRVESPRARARLLRESAAAFDAAGQRDEAAGALEAAVEADPTQLAALDALARLLAASKRWSYLAAMFRRLAASCSEVSPEGVARATRAAILGRLGSLLRDRLSDPKAALEAFAGALADAPYDPSMHVAALLVALDARDARAALEHVEPAARSGQLDLEVTLRLRDLLLEQGRGAAAERAAIVAEALGATDEATLAAAAAARVPGAPLSPLTPVGHAAWMGDEIDRALDAFLAAIAPAAAAARLEVLTRAGGLPDLDGGTAPDPASAVARAIAAAARILGTDPPRVVVVAEGRVPLQVPPAAEPCIVACQDATDGLPPRELAFLAGLAVAKTLEAHPLVALYPEAGELDSVILGAASIALPAVTIEEAWTEATARRRAELEPWLGEDDLAALADATRALAATDLPLDGAAWQRAVARRLDRAGLLVAGDILAAVSVVAREDGDGERLDDLLGFYLSSAYEEVLREVGGSLMPPPLELAPGPAEAPAAPLQASRIDG